MVFSMVVKSRAYKPHRGRQNIVCIKLLMPSYTKVTHMQSLVLINTYT